MFKPKRQYKDNLSGLIGSLTDDLLDGKGEYSEFKEWLIIKTLKLSNEQLRALKSIIVDFARTDEVKDLDIKKGFVNKSV